MRLILTLALLLATAAPVAAIPVRFDPPATFHALACKWGTTFNRDGRVAPPCGGPFEVRQFLPSGDPTSLWGTLVSYPGGFASGDADLVSQDRRITTGGLERFPIAPAGPGDYLFGVALSHIDYNALTIYAFTLEWPKTTPTGPGLPGTAGSPPLEPVPEPATLLLLGTALVGVGIAARKRRGR